ncbi:MAG TPA: hypothetical protein VFF06_00080 [Polyangia bacterium]|nr:hypothetical protein [Polyangia bacterium]
MSIAIALSFVSLFTFTIAGCGDAGAGQDASIDSAPFDSPPLSCRYPDGRICGNGQVGNDNPGCPSTDGCNFCNCEFVTFTCTEIACTDGSAPHD